jgi:hypothetical protein
MPQVMGRSPSCASPQSLRRDRDPQGERPRPRTRAPRREDGGGTSSRRVEPCNRFAETKLTMGQSQINAVNELSGPGRSCHARLPLFGHLFGSQSEPTAATGMPYRLLPSSPSYITNTLSGKSRTMALSLMAGGQHLG